MKKKRLLGMITLGVLLVMFFAFAGCDLNNPGDDDSFVPQNLEEFFDALFENEGNYKVNVTGVYTNSNDDGGNWTVGYDINGLLSRERNDDEDVYYKRDGNTMFFYWYADTENVWYFNSWDVSETDDERNAFLVDNQNYAIYYAMKEGLGSFNQDGKTYEASVSLNGTEYGYSLVIGPCAISITETGVTVEYYAISTHPASAGWSNTVTATFTFGNCKLSAADFPKNAIEDL